MSVLASANAVADNVALAYAGVTAIDQYAAGSSAMATVVNTADANIKAAATAVASGQNGASATAYAPGISRKRRPATLRRRCRLRVRGRSTAPFGHDVRRAR